MSYAALPSRERGPDFVGVGVQKSGTTWVADVLQQHPQVLMRKKEISFFTRYFHRGYGWYEKFFEDKQDRIAGELSVNYMYSPRPDSAHREFYPKWNPRRSLYFWRTYPAARDELYARYPDVRVFAMFRNPVDRAWSHYWFWRRRRERNQKRIVPFDQFFEDDARWIHTQGCYADLVEGWRERFPEIALFFYDDIRNDPKTLARRVYRLVGVDERFDPELTREVNVGSKEPMPDAARERLTRVYREQIERFQTLSGRDLSSWLEPSG